MCFYVEVICNNWAVSILDNGGLGYSEQECNDIVKKASSRSDVKACNVIKKTTIGELKKGDFFTLKPVGFPSDRLVYVRGDYDRSEKKYSCYKWEDVNHETMKKSGAVCFTGFTF